MVAQRLLDDPVGSDARHPLLLFADTSRSPMPIRCAPVPPQPWPAELKGRVEATEGRSKLPPVFSAASSKHRTTLGGSKQLRLTLNAGSPKNPEAASDGAATSVRTGGAASAARVGSPAEGAATAGGAWWWQQSCDQHNDLLIRRPSPGGWARSDATSEPSHPLSLAAGQKGGGSVREERTPEASAPVAGATATNDVAAATCARICASAAAGSSVVNPTMLLVRWWFRPKQSSPPHTPLPGTTAGSGVASRAVPSCGSVRAVEA